ncbi:MAG: ROK family glucokinase [Actinomycetota bacterium]
MGRSAIGLDVGGTKIAAYRVAEDGSVEERAQTPTPERADEILSAMASLCSEVRADGVEAVGVGAAGMVETGTGVLRYAPNLPWREVALGEIVARSTGLPCLVDNDANVAAWGEFRFGAGVGSSDMLLVTVGTGIGGGIVLGRKLFRGAHGFAAEIGHVIVEPNGPLCGCGNRGCWEQVAAGRAIDRLGRESALAHPDALFVRLSGGADRVTGSFVTEAAKQDDPVAVAILSDVGRRLGEGMAGLANILDPDIIVVGGGAVVAGDLLLDPARRAFGEALEAPDHRPDVPIVAAKLGNEAGAIGAATLALEELAT